MDGFACDSGRLPFSSDFWVPECAPRRPVLDPRYIVKTLCFCTREVFRGSSFVRRLWVRLGVTSGLKIDAKRTHNRRTGGPRGAILNTPHSVLKDLSFRGGSRYGHPDRNLQRKNTGNLHGEGFSKLQICKADFYSFPIPIWTDFEANFI